MANESLGKAKSRKNDEFYTVYDYIQKEMNAYLEYDPNVFRGKTILLPCDMLLIVKSSSMNNIIK